MIRILLPLLLIWPLQETTDRFRAGTESGGTWTLFGPAAIEDDSDLLVSVRRMERRWDKVKAGWIEIRSDFNHIRSTAISSRKRFEATMKPGPAGRYFARVGTELEALHEGEFTLGSVEAIFAKGPKDVKAILALLEETLRYLGEIERFIKHPDEATSKAREPFCAKVGETKKRVAALEEETDLTGTLKLLLEGLHHIHNTQIFGDDKVPAPASNDAAVNKKHVFIQPDLTLAKLRKQLEAIPAALSSEIKISTTLLLHRSFVSADTDDRALESARSAARAASKFAEAAPEPDKDLIRILDLAADRQTSPADIREQLKQAGQSLLLR